MLVQQGKMGKTEGTGVVPTKNPPNVKLANDKISKNSIVRELGIF